MTQDEGKIQKESRYVGNKMGNTYESKKVKVFFFLPLHTQKHVL